MTIWHPEAVAHQPVLVTRRQLMRSRQGAQCGCNGTGPIMCGEPSRASAGRGNCCAVRLTNQWSHVRFESKADICGAPARVSQQRTLEGRTIDGQVDSAQ